MTLVIMSHRLGEGGRGVLHGTLYATVLTSSSILQVYEYKTITFLLANMYNFYYKQKLSDLSSSYCYYVHIWICIIIF
jgi:hypothetical protein